MRSMKARILLLIVLIVAGVTLKSQQHYAEWVKVIESGGTNSHFNNIIHDGESFILNGYYTGGANFQGIELPYDLSPNGLITKLDENGEIIWYTTVTGSGIDIFFDIALNSQNDIFLAGWTSTYDTLRVNGAIVLEANGAYSNRSMIMKLSGDDGGLEWIQFITAEEYTTLNSTKIAIDEQDNIYVSGYYNAPFEVDGIQFPYTKIWGDDIFILKLDQNGAAQWGQYFTSEANGGFSTIRSMVVNEDALYFAVDYSAAIYVNGELLPHTGEYYWLAVMKASKTDGEVINYNAFGSESGQLINQINLDNDNNLIVVGFFEAGTQFSIGGIMLEGYGYNDGFIAKMNANLEVLWAKEMGGDYLDRAFNVKIDESNSIYIGGGFDCFTDFQYDGEVVLNSANPNSLSSFEIITDSNGNFLQSAGMYGSSNETVLSYASGSVLTAGNNINIYCVGNFNYGVSFVENEPLFAFHNQGYFYKWVLSTITGVDKNNKMVDMKIYPNPATEFVIVDPAGIEITIQVFDQKGAVVYTNVTNTTTTIDVSGLSSGTYFITTKSGNMQQSYKLIKK